MRQRLVLFLFGIVAIGWILYSSYDLLSNENLVDFKHYFNAQDQKVYIIQDPSSVNWDNESIGSTELNKSIYYSIQKQRKSFSNLKFYFSANQTKILIEQKGNWTQNEVEALLKNGLFSIEIRKMKQFSYGKLNGRYNKNQLLIYEGELPTAKAFELNISSKASYAWFTLSSQNELQLTETYFKKNARYRYIKYKNSNPALRKQDDQVLFASATPDFFNNYFFYDKEYALQLDPQFAKSPWFMCIQHGFVVLKQDTSQLVIFDFKENSNPILTLNEFFRMEELNTESAAYKNLKFSAIVSEEKATWYVATFGQFGFASSSKVLLDQSLAAATLGQTLSQNESKSKRIFLNMPKKVSARWVDAHQKKTITLLGGQVVETSYQKLEAQDLEQQDQIRDYFIMNPGFRVLKFAAFAERGNVIALTENHQIVGYINGLRKWDKDLAQEVKALYQIDGFPQLICVQFDHEAQLYDKTGRLVYRLTHEAGTRIQLLENKGKKEFACVGSPNSLQLFGETGSLIKQFNLGANVRQIHGFKSGGKSYVSILTDTHHQIIDLAKRKVTIKQNTDSTYVLVGNASDAFAIKIEKTTATLLSLAGQKQFEVPDRVQCIGSYSQANNQMIIFKRNTGLFAFNSKGQRIWEKTLNAVEVSQFVSFKGLNQQTILSVIDAVGNQIFLLDEFGRNLDKDKRHGQQEVQLSSFGNNAYSITTYLGNYLIQYNKQ